MNEKNTLHIGYFYPDLLNLYGDNGNVEVLVYRAKKRGINVIVHEITTETALKTISTQDINFVFMGGGPDSGQKEMYTDLVSNKADFLKDYISNGGVGMYICGAYQLLGNYYKAADGAILDGLGIFNIHTHHFGNHKPRCIGNIVCSLNAVLTDTVEYQNLQFDDNFLVGFENHGGRTYFDGDLKPLGTLVRGFGNNGEDNTEGVVFKNSIGTYLHGPILSKNPQLCDYLLAKALGVTVLPRMLDKNIDKLVSHAHKTALTLK